MADLKYIFGGAWSPPPEKAITSPEQQLIDAIISSGLEPPDHINLDGKLHRFRSGTKGSPKGGEKPGWYVAFNDGVPAGRFGCWRLGIESTWRADIGRKFSPAEEMAHAMRMSEAKALRDAAMERQHEVAENTVSQIWTPASAANSDHPYLKRKGIQPHGARITGDGRLMLPLYDKDGTLSSLQYIDSDGGKLYHPGAQTSGKFWMAGSTDDPGTLYVAEGFATAATIHEATGRPCVVAYSASNLVSVTASLREMYGANQDIVIVADNDSHGVGQKYADQASAKYGARVIMPPIEGMDANDYLQAGHDLNVLLTQKQDSWLIPADSFSEQPAPISWLVKHWVQDNALVMVHGPSGGGKTFVVLDWCLRMAAGIDNWCSNKVKRGNVVYLAGEGHHGLRGRIAAWKHHHQAKHLSMWLSKDGCDLNTPSGYLKVVEQVRMLPKVPCLIVVDTLHRFLAGDENSAQDAKTMLDACSSLMSEFGCSVILVHHTGVSDEAQHRARGSSAWRGALDIEISISPATDKAPMQIIQRKSKDAEMAETIFVELKKVEIPNWYDEENQLVTSAIIVQAEAIAAPKKESKIESHRKMFENAWWATGTEERQGLPYLSRSALRDKLISDGNSDRAVRDMINPSNTDKLIGALIQATIIEGHEHGWIMTNETHAATMLLSKNSR